ncbi:hypothetical protein [Actinophytocola oryzae]|uniref:PE family protein n=1 Tax=Actinophytocola oryzae TaxID=502181 RepID=A0A4R7VDF2_9PSEU|nr:hypothetical protein [Actinophytocola oryzae]TDV47162.1 hypothetical protein CLV71_110346 [Actinophytocola oryzae]
MYVDDTSGGSSSDGWAVDPSQVQAFAQAVADVRQQLDLITREVEDLASPDYAPMLGTSPVGQELAEKFTDRLGSEKGLRGQLNLAVTHMEEFVLAAEHTASSYLQVDADNASTYKYG